MPVSYCCGLQAINHTPAGKFWVSSLGGTLGTEDMLQTAILYAQQLASAAADAEGSSHGPKVAGSCQPPSIQAVEA